jgi:hypothetical protein
LYPLIIAGEQIMAKTAVKKPAAMQLPKGWFVSGESPSNYEAGIDREVDYDGKQCFVLKTKESRGSTGEWAPLMTGMVPSKYQGKRVRLSVWLKTESVGWVAHWMRVNNGKNILSFDNGCQRQLSGTTDWQCWSSVLDVPEGSTNIACSTNIAYGVMLGGSGKVWMVEPVLEEVATDVSPTNCPCVTKNTKSKGKARKLSPAKGWNSKVVYPSGAKYEVGIDASHEQ